ncbi:MAG TPA: Bro-N domain-containing protein [Candidatus Faecalibacterium faecipullorum]|uniref:Bro-N domain-containing protein n=1 Tax=Candidatus Faecalibacterium faecipullorum TaxID=2838578 RepID=A0A9D2S7Q7_9FIRM|nr:Bro-N domain-containing protein [Candidatus Faecalibacterium faecipullorum]
MVGKDVAEVLGYATPQKAVRDHVDNEDRTVNESFTVNGTPLTLINESGLYSLVRAVRPSPARFSCPLCLADARHLPRTRGRQDRFRFQRADTS